MLIIVKYWEQITGIPTSRGIVETIAISMFFG